MECAGGVKIQLGDHVCHTVRFKRTAGTTPDVTTVTIFVDNFDNFQLRRPPPKQLLTEGQADSGPQQAALSNRKPRDIQFSPSMDWAEPLILQEVVDDQQWPEDGSELVIPQLFVSSISKLDAGEPSGQVIVSLHDIRILWADRGYLNEHWAFNGQDGTLSGSLEEIAKHIVSRLPGSPELVRSPEDWKTIEPEIKFKKYTLARAALERIQREFGCRVCLNLDGSIAIWDHGETNAPGQERVAFTPSQQDSAKEINSRLVDLPPLYSNATGHIAGREQVYVPDVIVVSGKPRIASVAIDCWEPVLRINKQIVPLREGLQLLFEQAQGRARADALEVGDPVPTTTPQSIERRLAWLQRAVLRPEMLSDHQELGDREAEILRRDAYRLWRLPNSGTVNAHLLPMLSRAEVDPSSGQRLPVAVETYRHKTLENKLAAPRVGVITLNGSVVPDNIRNVRELEHLFNESTTTIEYVIDSASANAALAGSVFDTEVTIFGEIVAAFGGDPDFEGFNIAEINSGKAQADAFQKEGGAGLEVLSRRIRDRKDLDNAAQEALGISALMVARDVFSQAIAWKRNELIARNLRQGNQQTAQNLAAQYSSIRDRYFSALEAVDPNDTSRLKVEFLEAVQKVGAKYKQNQDLIFTLSAQEPISLLSQIISRERAKRGATATAGGTQERGRKGQTFAVARAAVNLPRSVDPGARIEDAKVGLVRTQSPVGHVAPIGFSGAETPPRIMADGASGLQLVPRAVRVTFGVQARPKRETVSDGRVVTGSPERASWCPLDQPEDIIPEQARKVRDGKREDLGYTHFVFERQEKGGSSSIAEVKDLSTVDPTEASPLHAPELQELIELDGSSNIEELREDAKARALKQMNETRLTERRQFILARPWRVNTDGVVAGVEIRENQGLKGLQTIVVTGDPANPFGETQSIDERRTRERGRTEAQRDSQE